MEEDIGLDGLAGEAIHRMPANLFEKTMVALLFRGEKTVREIKCVFYDRYSRSRNPVAAIEVVS